ncbi:MAG: outer membrane beta-barrel protein [Alphaproteobacteria bacterium]
MNKFLLLIVPGLLLCGQALAAVGEGAGEGYSWTSCYAGGNLGYGWQRDHAVDTINANFNTGGNTGRGPIGGAQIGCDYQFANRFVVGVQGMFDGAGINGSHPYLPGGGTEALAYNTDWAGSLTGRVGYAVIPQVLLYLKSGVTGDHINYTDSDPTGPYTFKATATRLGWTIGGGTEYAFQPNWSAFAEYSYTDLGSRNTNFLNSGSASGYASIPDSYMETHNLQTVLIGLNYHFASW